jgi:hypothetical protein
VEAKRIEVDLDIGKSFGGVLPSKRLVLGCIAVFFQSILDGFSLLVREKAGRRGIVVNEEICGYGYKNGK